MTIEHFKNHARRLIDTIWVFPILLTLVLLALTFLRISGSSMGTYYSYFYGNRKDPALLAGKPRTIRSDEWVVNTQMTIAQKNNGFAKVNQNVGEGEDTAVILDVPHKGWSELFSPHNWAFFILPLEQAFAFKWWVMGYLLTLSCYFFVLLLFPGRRLLAAFLSTSFFFSGFVQWWYQYITLGSLYYSLFAGIAGIKLFTSNRTRSQVLWSGFLCYVLVCFALVQYPPFQIPCALAIGTFFIGYTLQQRRKMARDVIRPLLFILASLVVAGLIIICFLLTESTVIHTITNTAYPGKRIVTSGGFDIAHVLSGQLAFQFQSDSKAAAYHIMSAGYWNQSEAANFVLLIPFLLIPSFYLLYYDKRQNRSIDWTLVGCTLFIALCGLWLFIPHLGILGKLTLLDKVPLNRLLIGLGLMNSVYIVLISQKLSSMKNLMFRRRNVLIYSVLVLVIELLLGLHAHRSYPGFIGHYRVVALSIPVPIIIYLLLRKRFELSAALLVVFSILSSGAVNPLYKGMSILTSNPLSSAIKHSTSQGNGRWILETGFLENFALMNGKPSLSGVYTYPQLGLWSSIGNSTLSSVYNRYAHVTITFNRQDPFSRTSLVQPAADHFGVNTNPCSPFVSKDHIKDLITETPLNSTCADLQQTITSSGRSFYFYRID